MTLREHLANIRKTLLANRATNEEALLFLLYLLSLGWDEFLYPDKIREGLSDAIRNDPYKTLLEKTPIKEMWSKAKGKVDLDEPNALDLFFDDEEIIWNTPKETFLETFNELLNGTARSFGYEFDHFQPAELTDLVFRLSGYQKGMTIYNPFAGIGSYAGPFSCGNNYFGEELDPVIWGIGVLRSHINGNLSENYICGDSLRRKWAEPFDVVVSTPPFGIINPRGGSFPEQLIKDASFLMNENGVMLLVTNGGFPFSAKGERCLVESGMLDMIINLPEAIFYWTSAPPVIIRLKNGRKKNDPVHLIDGSSFFTSAGRRLNSINVAELLYAIETDVSNVSIRVSLEQIKENDSLLYPPLYLNLAKERVNGKRLVPLRDLGAIIKHWDIQEQPEFVIHGRDLSEDPLKLDIRPTPREVLDNTNFGILTQDALLIGGTMEHPKFGYVKASKGSPVGIATNLYAFIPNDSVTPQYIAVTLAQKGIQSIGASFLTISRQGLAVTGIPFIPKSEQRRAIREFEWNHHPNPGAPFPSIKVRVAVIGSPEIPEYYVVSLDKRVSFATIKEARSWVRNEEHRKKIDAVIINQTPSVSNQDILLMCGEDLPVFILTQDTQDLETFFGKESDEWLNGRCFPSGGEADMFASLFRYVDEQNSPEGRIREIYAEQLKAAENLDRRFCYPNFKLHDWLESILLSPKDDKDLRSELRTIRDKCLLEPLIKYGYLPPKNNYLTYGAEVILLDDRYFKEAGGVTYLLTKTVIPQYLAHIMRAISPILNDGAHNLSSFDKNIQLIALHVIMAWICHLSDLNDIGKFDNLNPEKVHTEFIDSLSSYSFISREYEVKNLKDDASYFFAGQTHLDPQACAAQCIHVGDRVLVLAAQSEKQPKITDFEKIVFYSKKFKKIQRQ